MAEKKRSDAFGALVEHLRSFDTVTELFKLANSDEFGTAAKALPPDELTELRQVYRDVQSQLDGKVKLDTFDDGVIEIIGVDYWHSESYNNDGVTLKFQVEGETPRHKYKALTSSAPIVRFCQRFARELPTPDRPVRAYVKLVPVSDVERARQGQRIWTIKQLPALSQAPVGAPF